MRGWSTPDESQVKIGEHLLTVQGSVFTEDDEGVKVTGYVQIRR